MTTHNTLTGRQKFQLCTLLDQSRAEIENEKPTQAQFAEQCTRSLGFEVTKFNVVGASESIGFKWPNVGSTVGWKARSKLAERVSKLEKDVEYLLAELGVRVNP